MTMPPKIKVPKNAEDKEQSEQFIEIARKMPEDGGEALERAFKRAVPPKKKSAPATR
jgi:hypothetical protein